MEFYINIFEIIFGIEISNKWKKEHKGTRKQKISIEFYIQDLRIV